jgi:hypothetical protein
MREARMTHQLLNPKRSIHNNLAGFGGFNSAIEARHAMNKQDMKLGRWYALPDSVCLVTQRHVKDLALSGEIACQPTTLSGILKPKIARKPSR